MVVPRTSNGHSWVLAAVEIWEPVWDNHGSDTTGFYTLWCEAEAAHYLVVGGIFSNNVNYAVPTAYQTKSIVAIHKSPLGQRRMVRLGYYGRQWDFE
ncbi:hypothetical protein C8F04DRAFT_1276963 [Mycena alexandri]|uniref:Uncharacterized protein n=1 Tax=Mycena alexandri TaxID=1745969 RepID=A0AAD6S0C7_9AGAR|nr:hypothetical protein C8F04DRAFT_1276963 [Mycena alexandri]